MIYLLLLCFIFIILSRKNCFDCKLICLQKIACWDSFWDMFEDEDQSQIIIDICYRFKNNLSRFWFTNIVGCCCCYKCCCYSSCCCCSLFFFSCSKNRSNVAKNVSFEIGMSWKKNLNIKICVIIYPNPDKRHLPNP